MFDLLLLFVFLFLFSAMIRKKSIVLKICNAVLFVSFFFVILFTTDNQLISSIVSKLVGRDNYDIITGILTNPTTLSYAAVNSIWLLYKIFLILFIVLYGFYVVTDYIVGIFTPVRYKLINSKSVDEKQRFNYISKDYGTKKFLCFERLLN